MFLKDKYLASGAFERFKARLVARSNQQDKGLSSPTVATSSVLAIAAIAAAERRKVIAIDIGGAFLNADMAPTRVEVHMRLNRIMTSMLMQLDPSYEKYREPDDTVVVRLDKALY
jgi:dihydroxyacetone kinase DhaKLM complex PTS-EIIA-like component DhaM